MLRQIKTRHFIAPFVMLVALMPVFIPIASVSAGATPLTIVAAQSPPKCQNPQLGVDENCKVKGSCTDAVLTASNCAVLFYLLALTNVLSGLVGITVVIMIIVGGIQYSAAGDDPQKVGEAKKKITNALLALLIFIFMFAFLQWVIPGGLF